PESQAALGRLQDRLKSSQASFEVQPRVFYEGFSKLVLYVNDVKSARGAAIWKGVFIADMSTPSAPRITLARQGILLSESPETLHLHLNDGATHETDPAAPEKYQISTFQQTDIPIPVPQADTKEHEPAPAAGAWLADIVCFVCGAFLLWRAERRPLGLGALRGHWNLFPQRSSFGPGLMRLGRAEDAFQKAATRRRVFSARFPMLLDDYVL